MTRSIGTPLLRAEASGALSATALEVALRSCAAAFPDRPTTISITSNIATPCFIDISFSFEQHLSAPSQFHVLER